MANDLMERDITDLLARSAEANLNTAKNLEVVVGKLKEHDDNIGELATKYLELNEETKAWVNRLEQVEQNELITPAMARMLQKCGAKRIIKILGKPGSKDYVRYSRTFYRRLWTDLKDHFAVPSYTYVRVVDYQAACDFVEAWVPSNGIQGLKEEIERTKIEQEKERIETLYSAQKELEQEKGDNE